MDPHGPRHQLTVADGSTALGWVTSANRPAGRPSRGVDVAALTRSIAAVTGALGGEALEFYERDLPERAAAEAAGRVRADVVALLLDNGEDLLEVAGGVGLADAERRLRVGYDHGVMRELFRAGVGVIEDTRRVREALAGIPGNQVATMVMVPLVHQRVGFGALVAGRPGPAAGTGPRVFTQGQVDTLLGFADSASASLHTAALVRHLRGQLRALEGPG